MKQELEKYVWYYLSVYIIILTIYAAFDYFISCSGNSLNCKVDWSNVKDILQTTAYIVTPIVAIAGFLAWREVHNKSIQAEIAKKVWSNLDRMSEVMGEINKKFNNLYYLSDEEFLKLDLYIVNEAKQLNHIMANLYSEVRLLDSLLGKNELSKLVKYSIISNYHESANAWRKYDKISTEFTSYFYPMQKSVKEILIPIIRA